MVESDESMQPDSRTQRLPRTGLDASLLLLTGFFATLGGLALCVGPKISWKLTQISEGFAYLGLFGGTLFMGGLVLVAMSTLRRGQNQLRRELWQLQPNAGEGELSDDVQAIGEIVEQLEADVSGLRQSFQVLLDQGLGSVRQQIESLAKEQQQTTSQDPDDAVFRMAASLDQLGAQLGRQLDSRVGELEQRLEALHANHDTVVSRISESIESLRHDTDAARATTLARVEQLLENRLADLAEPSEASEYESPEPARSYEPAPSPEPTADVEGVGAALPAHDRYPTSEQASEALLSDTRIQRYLHDAGSDPEEEPDAAPKSADDSSPAEMDDVSAALPSANASPFDLGQRAMAVGSETEPEHAEDPSSAAQEGSLRDALERMRRECDPE